MNNAFLGMTIQKFICQKYNVPMHPNSVSQFTSSYNKDYEPGLTELTDAVFKEIGKAPKQCLTFAPSEKGKETLSPHNFLLSDGTTLSIRTNKTGDRVAPRVVGQCGLYIFNAFFSDLAGYEIKSQAQIKSVVLQHIEKMIPIFLDYLFVSDYTVWVQYNEGKYSYTIFDRNQFVDIEPNYEHFSFTRASEEWKESTTLKYKGISIAEIQLHKNRLFKFRFIMKALQKFIVEAKMTTETLGMTAEKTICDLFSLAYPDNFKGRVSARLQEEIAPTVKAAFKNLPAAIKHTGSEKGERGKDSKGYIIVTHRGVQCDKCGQRKARYTLTPVLMNQKNSVETIPPKLKQKICALFDFRDAYTGIQNPNAEAHIPDHKFPEDRWNTDTAVKNDVDMSTSEIKAKFQLLNAQTNMQKKQACGECIRTGKRGYPFGIKYYYAGTEDWDKAIPSHGKAAESGCIGCGWYDMLKWKEELNKKLNK